MRPQTDEFKQCGLCADCPKTRNLGREGRVLKVVDPIHNPQQNLFGSGAPLALEINRGIGADSDACEKISSMIHSTVKLRYVVYG